MVNVEYANAYSEVLEILKCISKEDYNKIPKEKIKLLETNANKEHDFFYNPEKTLDEQGVSKIAKTIIALFFRDYWATDEQRRKIITKQKYDREQIENKKREKYGTTIIFKETKEKKQQNDNNSLITYKHSFLQTIIGKIKSIFNIK